MLTEITRLLSFAILLILTGQSVEGGKYGEWRCKSNGDDVSRGDFTDFAFGPFVSPRVLTNSKSLQSGCAYKYYHGLECEFKFHAPDKHLVYVEFTTIDLDQGCNKDFIKIDMKHGQRSVCGNTVRYTYDISKTNEMTVTFNTDQVNQCSGFAAFFTSFVPGSRRKRSMEGAENQQSEIGSNKTKRSTTGDLTAYQLNMMMQDYRYHHYTHLQECRRVLTNVWLKSPCSICGCREIGDCECQEPARRKRRVANESKTASLKEEILRRVRRASTDCSCRR